MEKKSWKVKQQKNSKDYKHGFGFPSFLFFGSFLHSFEWLWNILKTWPDVLKIGDSNEL